MKLSGLKLVRFGLPTCVFIAMFALVALTAGCGGCSGSEVSGTYMSPFNDDSYIQLKSDCTWSLRDSEGTLTGKFELSGTLSGTRITLLSESAPGDWAKGTVSEGVLNISGVGRWYKR